MRDIVEMVEGYADEYPELSKAAEEIERLRAEAALLRVSYDAQITEAVGWADKAEALEEEVERLRERLAAAEAVCLAVEADPPRCEPHDDIPVAFRRWREVAGR